MSDAERREARLVVIGLVLLVAALALPYALRGPKLLLDDWPVVRNRHFDGVLATAGHNQLRARPGAWLVYTLTFGLVGPHPLALYAVQVALDAAVVVALFLAARRFVPQRVAAAVAVVWALLPNHSTLEHWASTVNVVVCLLLLLAGVVLLARACERGSGVWPAVACLAASTLCYEASIVAGAVAVVAVPWLVTGRIRRDVVAAGWLALLADGVWMFSHTAPGRTSTSKFADFALLYRIHFGAGITTSTRVGAVVAVVAAVGIGVALGRLVLPGLRANTGLPERLVVAGLVVIVAGSLPFAKFPIAIIGVNDRANVVGSVGAALVWVGLGGLLWRLRAVAAVAALAFAAAVLPVHVQRDRAFARAGDDAVRLLHDLRRVFPRPAGAIVVGPAPINRRGVVGLLANLDTTPAVQLAYRDPHLRARVAQDERDFATASEPLRFDQVRRVIVSGSATTSTTTPSANSG